MRARNVFLFLTLFVLVDALPAVGQEATKPAVLPVLEELQDEISISSAIDESAGAIESSAETGLATTTESGTSDATDEDLVRLEELAVKQAVAFIAPSVVKIESLGEQRAAATRPQSVYQTPVCF